jgi:poly(3-hydroxybutyrate) depolymerase
MGASVRIAAASLQTRACSLATVIACFLVASPSRADVLAPGDYEGSFRYQGHDRTYEFRVPTGYDGSASVPLVLDLHGFGSFGGQQKLVSGYANLADAEGFVVAHPDGIPNAQSEGNAWNIESCCGTASALDVDDVGFLKVLAGVIAEQIAIDPSRIYATGLSNGGGMSHRLGCEGADFFAAVAPMAFPIPYFDAADCQPVQPQPVQLTMGLTDTVVPYAGAVPSFEYWRDVNGCVDPAETTFMQGAASCDTHDQCEGGVVVTLCSVVGRDFTGTLLEDVSGHLLYANEDGVDLARESWAFLSGFQQVPPPVLVPEPGSVAQGVTVLMCLSALIRSRARRRRA